MEKQLMKKEDCDVHFLYMYRDTYACLEPKFEWKRVIPIGELQLVSNKEPEKGPLSNITEKTLDTESNNRNIVKDETVTDNEETAPVPSDTPSTVTDELGLVPIPPLPSTNTELPDATQNLIVPLPIDEHELTDATY